MAAKREGGLGQFVGFLDREDDCTVSEGEAADEEDEIVSAGLNSDPLAVIAKRILRK